jgi:plastocyanin
VGRVTGVTPPVRHPPSDMLSSSHRAAGHRVLSAAAALLIVACGTSSPVAPTQRSPSPTPTPVVIADPSPTPTPTPTPTPAPTPRPSPAPSPTPTPTPTPPSGGIVITINGLFGPNSFQPANAVAKVGQTVTWKNADTMAHNIGQSGGAFSVPDIAPGAKSRPVKLTTAGTFAYYCVLHPAMTGSLQVDP